MIVIISSDSYSIHCSERFWLHIDLSLLFFNTWRSSISRLSTLVFASWGCLQFSKQLFFLFHRFSSVKIVYLGEIIFFSEYVVFYLLSFRFWRKVLVDYNVLDEVCLYFPHMLMSFISMLWKIFLYRLQFAWGNKEGCWICSETER